MKSLLLGSNGQLGYDICRLYASGQYPPINLISFNRKEFDLTQKQKLYNFLESQTFDILLNCTGYNLVDAAESHEQEAFAVNAEAIKVLAEVCEIKKARLIHVSSDYVFSGHKTSPYLEEDATGPLSVYGASKLKGESLALTNHENTLILRVASLFGIAGSSGKGGNFVETMINKGKELGSLKVINDIRMSPTSTLDIAKMIFELIRQEAAPGIYHAVNDGDATWYKFASEIIKMTKLNVEVIPVSSKEFPSAAQRPAYSVLDNHKIKTIVGALPHWTEALHHYLLEKGHLS